MLGNCLNGLLFLYKFVFIILFELPGFHHLSCLCLNLIRKLNSKNIARVTPHQTHIKPLQLNCLKIGLKNNQKKLQVLGKEEKQHHVNL